MKTKKMRKGAIAVLGAVLAGCVSAAGVGFAGGLPALAMNTASATEIISGDLWDSDAKSISKAPLQSLTSIITGGSTSYQALTSTLNSATDKTISAADLRSNNSNKDIVVTFGGKQWTVTYVSEDMSGNVIATLWLADGGHTDLQPFSAGWTASSTTYDPSIEYPANMYSTSYIRSYLNGTPYVQAAGATPGTTELAVSSNSDLSINLTGVQGDTWETFLSDSKASFLVAPQSVSWQVSGLEDNPGVSAISGSIHYPNNMLYSTVMSPDYSQKGSANTAYTAWGGDLLWLPSVLETGATADLNGLWKLSVNQRSNDGGTNNTAVGGSSMKLNYTLLRSAGQHSKGATLLLADGNGLRNDFALARSAAVRPAIHFNLTKAFANNEGGADDIYNEGANAFDRVSLNSFYAKLGATDYSALANKVSGGATFSSAQLANLN
ncbi:MAG: hypothetical protein K2N30_03305, partial [Clostridia bacterium]|nr:hypothetical protein [Clostridia bacterium]